MTAETGASADRVMPWAHPPDGRAALPAVFFDRDPREVAPDLLGCVFLSRSGGTETGGVIVETEAYLGSDDPGSHAATKGVTKRNAVMYGRPGTVYVYFTYGNHHMLNLVCCPDGIAGAVLVRALEPVCGVATMSARRGGRNGRDIANGPGKLAAALGVDLTDNGTSLATGRLIVYDGAVPSADIAVSGRVGLSAGHDLHLRYYVRANEFVSKGRTGPPAGSRRTDTRPA